MQRDFNEVLQVKRCKSMNQVDDLAEILPSLLPRLWRFGLRLARNKEDAEDLVQRACVRALERRHQLQPGTSALSWTFSIMHSVWLNEVRGTKLPGSGGHTWHSDRDRHEPARPRPAYDRAAFPQRRPPGGSRSRQPASRQYARPEGGMTFAEIECVGLAQTMTGEPQS